MMLGLWALCVAAWTFVWCCGEIRLDKGWEIWFNSGTMRQNDRLNSVSWWWPKG